MKIDYYFKFVVPCHYAMEFDTFEEAKKKSIEIDEKIYLTIFSKKNSYKEPYDDREIESEKDIETFKSQLIKSFLKLTSGNIK